jgi:hypothetical protein
MLRTPAALILLLLAAPHAGQFLSFLSLLFCGENWELFIE